MNRFFVIVVLIFSSFVLRANAADLSMEESIKTTVANYLANNFLNATFIFADDVQVIDMGAKGVSSLDDGSQLKANEKMPIASGTKPITATAILKLYDKGLLALNDPVSKYIGKNSDIWYDKMPSWAEKVTIHHLLTHSSGLQEYFTQLHIHPTSSINEINKSILNFAATNPTKFAPGTNYSYANTNYIILGMIIEKVGGKQLGEFLKDEIFTPLNMKSTHLTSYEEYLVIKHGQIGHLYPERYVAIPNNSKKPKLELVHDEIYFVPYADGGVISNTRDLISFYRGLAQGKLLSKKAYNLMITKHLKLANDKSNRTNYAGYGIYISELPNNDTMIHHSSRFEGSISESGYVPEKHLYFAIIGNVSTKTDADFSKIDTSKTYNQLDLVYFREAVLQNILLW